VGLTSDEVIAKDQYPIEDECDGVSDICRDGVWIVDKSALTDVDLEIGSMGQHKEGNADQKRFHHDFRYDNSCTMIPMLLKR